MPLIDGVQFLKGAVQRSLPGGTPSAYLFSGGVMFAQNAAILAAYPMVHILGEFSLAADDLERALARMSTEPTISAGDGTLIFKSGRLRSEITLMACEPPDVDLSSVNGWEPPPDRLMTALKAVKGFIPPDGTWQRGVKLEDGRVLAISNRSGCEVLCPGLQVLSDTVLTDDCVEYLTGLRSQPTEMCLTGGAAWFRWPNEAWARCQLMALQWPDCIFDRIIDGIGQQETPCRLSQEWVDAFADAAALCDNSGGHGTITVRPVGLHTKSGQGDHLAEFTTGATRETYWSLAALKPVFSSGASAWNPDSSGPALFSGDGVRGMVVGQRR